MAPWAVISNNTMSTVERATRVHAAEPQYGESSWDSAVRIIARTVSGRDALGAATV
jgi:hypothetical protein